MGSLARQAEHGTTKVRRKFNIKVKRNESKRKVWHRKKVRQKHRHKRNASIGRRYDVGEKYDVGGKYDQNMDVWKMKENCEKTSLMSG